MSVRDRQAVTRAAVSTAWAHTIVSAIRGIRWSEAGDAKVGPFFKHTNNNNFIIYFLC